jgi:hypothetical protein
MARHSDFMDGMLPTLAAARLRAHVGSCAACARYDRVVRKGIDLVRDLPRLEPTTDFERRLEHRLFHIDDARTLQSTRPAGAAATLVVAAVIAMLAWSPLLAPGGASTGTASRGAVAHDGTGTDRNGERVGPSGGTLAEAGALPAFMQTDSWYPLPASAPHVTVVAAFPGPYSPLIVTPPAHRAVRTVSSGYAPVD